MIQHLAIRKALRSAACSVTRFSSLSSLSVETSPCTGCSYSGQAGAGRLDLLREDTAGVGLTGGFDRDKCDDERRQCGAHNRWQTQPQDRRGFVAIRPLATTPLQYAGFNARLQPLPSFRPHEPARLFARPRSPAIRRCRYRERGRTGRASPAPHSPSARRGPR